MFKKNIHLILAFFAFVFSLTSLIIVISNKPKENMSPQEIYENSMYSVAELKVQLYDDVEEYGSAVLVSNDGLFATNAHLLVYKKSGILTECENIFLRFAFEEEYHTASLVKYDFDKDTAVIQIQNMVESTKPIEINNEKLNFGDVCYAVGNGMNHGIGITCGHISIPLTSINVDSNYRTVIQCDLVINSGNSGGALLDVNGKLIGITSFRMKNSDGSVVYSTAYCIPILEYTF